MVEIIRGKYLVAFNVGRLEKSASISISDTHSGVPTQTLGRSIQIIDLGAQPKGLVERWVLAILQRDYAGLSSKKYGS